MEKFHQTNRSVIAFVPLYPGDIVRFTESRSRTKTYNGPQGSAWALANKDRILAKGELGLVVTGTYGGKPGLCLCAKTGKLVMVDPDDVEIVVPGKDTPTKDRRQDRYLFGRS